VWWLIALLSLAPGCSQAGSFPESLEPASLRVEARHGDSVRATADGVPVLVLRGTHRQRGEAHGMLAAREIIDVIGRALAPVVNRHSPRAWDDSFLPAARRFRLAPRYRKELAGMLDGIRRALPDPADRRLRSLDREIGPDDLHALQCLGDVMGMQCSTITVWGRLTDDGGPLTARNLDYAAFPIHRYALVIAAEPAEAGLRPTVEFSAAGFVGASTTMSADGVFVAIHDVRGATAPTARSGLTARLPALRTALESARPAHAVADLAKALKGTKPALGSNVHVSLPRGSDGPATPAAVIEWEAAAGQRTNGVAVRTVRRPSDDDEPFILCTNHHATRHAHDPHRRPDSRARAERLARAARIAVENGRTIGGGEACGLLDSVCKRGRVVTHLSAIAWPDRATVAFAVSPAPGAAATGGQWRAVNIGEIFKLK